VHVIDTSSLIDLKGRYPEDVPVFAPIWKNMSRMAEDGTLIAPHEALLELRKGSDAATAWAEAHQGMFVDICPEQAAYITEIWKRIPAIDREKTGPHADPWVVALALRELKRKGTAYVITQESAKGPRRIPVICQAFDVPSLNLLGFFRKERWGT
jgi:hypothetical protein